MRIKPTKLPATAASLGSPRRDRNESSVQEVEQATTSITPLAGCHKKVIDVW